jgi:hypothetical protein
MDHPDQAQPGSVAFLSEDGSFIHIRSYKSSRSGAEMASRLQVAVELGRKHQINKVLLDARNTTLEAGIATQYDFAYHQAWQVGLARDWRVAMLVTPGDRSYDFMETALINSGYQAQLFVDPERARAWLTISDPRRTGATVRL